MSDLTLYTNPMSRGNSVVWMLEECEADYQCIEVEFGQAMHSDDYLQINPMGKVPALVHGELIMTESLAINTYLAELFGHKNLIPAVGTAQRGQYYRLLLLAQQFEYAMLDHYQGVTSSPERVKSIGYGSFDGAMRVLNSLFEDKTYLIDDQFGVIDLIYAALLAWGVNMIHVIPASEVIERYLTLMSSRPAFKRMLSKAGSSA